jgi:hypothetical protein
MKTNISPHDVVDDGLRDLPDTDGDKLTDRLFLMEIHWYTYLSMMEINWLIMSGIDQDKPIDQQDVEGDALIDLLCIDGDHWLSWLVLMAITEWTADVDGELYVFLLWWN